MNTIDTILDEIIRREGGYVRITRLTGAGQRTSASPRRRWVLAQARSTGHGS